VFLSFVCEIDALEIRLLMVAKYMLVITEFLSSGFIVICCAMLSLIVAGRLSSVALCIIVFFGIAG